MYPIDWLKYLLYYFIYYSRYQFTCVKFNNYLNNVLVPKINGDSKVVIFEQVYKLCTELKKKK